MNIGVRFGVHNTQVTIVAPVFYDLSSIVQVIAAPNWIVGIEIT